MFVTELEHLYSVGFIPVSALGQDALASLDLILMEQGHHFYGIVLWRFPNGSIWVTHLCRTE